ncbi:hypothetical protein [Azospirillum rugosum]|uniref:Uncharacterized protein n=1 Tax=Azospirillum rugosum TaxID=416170 RepID=A0ABS4SSI2_9PROT|nr:hypothetical protein [Azospirillum rugosum]MBP2295526.1 hypothetical protein [Azospirillum rugosum]MDQ0528405.1 hypothetical protein [Azospirillum rugosum]
MFRHRSLIRLSLTLPALLALTTACADPGADAALAAQSALVGMPKGTLMSCAGVPQRETASGGLEFLTYQAGSVSYYAPPPPIGYPWGAPGWRRRALDYDPWDYYPPVPGDVVDRRCEATFTLDGGVVQRLVYRASSQGACAAIVQNCLALVPQRTISRGAPQG